MKQRLLFALLFISEFASAQIVNIPDANFKSKLLQASATNGIARNQSYQSIVIDVNGDGEIQQSEALLVYMLNIPNSSIVSLEGITYFSNLNDFSCNNNSIVQLDLSGLSNLQYVNVTNNALTSLGTSGLVSLEQIYISNSLLTSVDLSNSPLLVYYNIYNNPNLVSINIKNSGNIEYPGECYIANNPLLETMCVDEGEADIMLQNTAYANITFITDCGVILPTYNTIAGHLTFDVDGDGCDAQDSNPYFIKIRLSDGTLNRYRYSISGDYIFLTAQSGNYTVTPFTPFQLFNFSPADASVNFTTIDGSAVTQNFCLTANGVQPDAEVTIAPLNAATPGFNARYRVSLQNRGNQPLSGSFTFTYDDGVLSYVESTLAPSATAPGTLTWQYSNLLPFEYKIAIVTLAVNTPTDSPAVNLGDTLSFTASAPVENDAAPADNAFVFNQTVVGSYDPNNIVCLEGATVPTDKIGEYLHYTINFENIGTAAADFVVVTNEIDTEKYDVSSVEIIDSTHEVDASLEDDILTFRFDDINLAPEAQGSVTFKIKSLASLEEGDAVMSQASIVFDFNEPLVTNEAVTTFDDVAATNEFGAPNVNMYPNPAKNLVTINAGSTVKTLNLYDIQGRLLLSTYPEATDASVNISAQPSGLYLLKITTDTGTVTRKILKE